jgi:hypothetical protein
LRLTSDVFGEARDVRVERGRRAAGLRFIQPAQLAHQHRQRPEVHDEVVRADEQHVVLRRPLEQADAQERPSLKIEALAGQRPQPLAQKLFTPTRGLLHAERDFRSFADAAHRRAEPRGKGRAQHRVTLGQRLKRTSQRAGVHLAADARGEREVIGRALGRDLLQKPERLLPVRERMLAGFARRRRVRGRRLA